MNKSKIYNYAMSELLRLTYEVEIPRLEKSPDSEVCKARVERLHREISELHALMIEEESEY